MPPAGLYRSPHWPRNPKAPTCASPSFCQNRAHPARKKRTIIKGGCPQQGKTGPTGLFLFLADSEGWCSCCFWDTPRPFLYNNAKAMLGKNVPFYRKKIITEKKKWHKNKSLTGLILSREKQNWKRGYSSGTVFKIHSHPCPWGSNWVTFSRGRMWRLIGIKAAILSKSHSSQDDTSCRRGLRQFSELPFLPLVDILESQFVMSKSDFPSLFASGAGCHKPAHFAQFNCCSSRVQHFYILIVTAKSH